MKIDPNLEFHRHAVALMPSAEDPFPGVAFYVAGRPAQRFCTCRRTGKGKKQASTCPHLKALAKAMGADGNPKKTVDLAQQFEDSVWYGLATVLGRGDQLTPSAVTIRFIEKAGKTRLVAVTPQGGTHITYESKDADRNRLAERMGVFSENGEEAVPDRCTVLGRMTLLTMTDAERQLADINMRSRRQALEGSLWYRLAYHCFLEFGPEGRRLKPSVDENTGAFLVSCHDGADRLIFSIRIASNRVRPLLDCLRQHLPNQHDLPIHPIPLKSLFRISQKTRTDLDVFPVIKLMQDEGEDRFFAREGLEKFIYGDLVYIPELKILAELEKPGKPRAFAAPKRMTFKKYQIPSFLETVGGELSAEGFIVDPDVKGMRLMRRWDSLTLAPAAIDRDWCWLAVNYGFGDERVSLADILKARQAGNRYIGTPSGWVDTQSDEIEKLATALAGSISPERFENDGRVVRLSRQELFQISALEPSRPSVDGEDEAAAALSRLLDLTPSNPPASLGLSSSLREYQQTGFKWLWWLWENRLGGLLCDDMGLGKTHQVMALMAGIMAKTTARRRCLVVCPTTVLSHWENKIRQHAPALSALVYHGTQRALDEVPESVNVLITSYGVLLRDIDKFDAIGIALAVFDEMQQIKNADTKTHQAANRLSAEVKIGLTGTPIENTILELKSLMDVVVPGYLDAASLGGGSDAAGANDLDADGRRRLRRLIYPFTLRRMKSTVLDELPPKIEDIRTCELTPKQVKLYRDAIDARAKGILASLADDTAQIPYIHIFALLTLLKQICNHPAQVEKRPVDPDDRDSGKWELFKELLSESLDSGQKVVVYSQFTEMIAIIAEHLSHQGIDHVVLTGRSRHRGKLIDRFNTDPACRVFVGSLKAGGTGIDLVAGSVVIHYDRWWNAAKEDQATDRVHRIGQQRGVQVFKLVTLGTLEEKISALIEKKRRLMADIVREDDPGLLKSFSREELMDMLS